LGMTNTYSIQMWESHKMTKGTLIGNWVRKYDKKVFPLYSSFKGGADGKMVNADSRQNIFSNKWLWIKLGLAVAVGIFAIRNVWNFFHPVDPSASAPVAAASSPGGVAPAAGLPVAPSFSSDWRVVGTMSVGAKGLVIIQNPAGQVRMASPSEFQLEGLSRIGTIDGQRVTTFSGQPSKSAFSAIGGPK